MRTRGAVDCIAFAGIRRAAPARPVPIPCRVGLRADAVERRYVTNQDRSAVLDAEKLARVTDAHVRMSLELQAAFGLRHEEVIKLWHQLAPAD